MQKPHLTLVRLPQICSDAAGGGDEWFEKGWEVLDPSIWSRLPGDVLERVLELLPVASVCRFRAVCCRWRVLLLRPRVCRMLASCLVPLLCTFDGAGADFQGMPVFRLDLSFLPLRYRKYWHTRFRFREEQDAFASHGGLVCITDGKKTPYTAGMCVFNPVTKAWRELPAMAAIFPDSVPADWRWSLGLRTFSGGFEVSVLCRTENPAVATTAIFFSQSGAWRIEYDHSGLLTSSHKVSLLVHQGMYHSPEWHYLLLQERKTALLHRTVHGEAFGEPQHVAGGGFGTAAVRGTVSVLNLFLGLGSSISFPWNQAYASGSWTSEHCAYNPFPPFQTACADAFSSLGCSLNLPELCTWMEL